MNLAKNAEMSGSQLSSHTVCVTMNNYQTERQHVSPKHWSIWRYHPQE